MVRAAWCHCWPFPVERQDHSSTRRTLMPQRMGDSVVQLKKMILLSGSALCLLASGLGGCSSFNSMFAGDAAQDRTPKIAQPVTAKASKPSPAAKDVTFHGDDAGAMAMNQPRAVRVGLFGDFADQQPRQPVGGESGGNLDQITFGEEGMDSDPAIDPDGKWIAFASTQHRKTANLYLKAVGGSTLTQLTDDPSDEVMPAFSPDGKRLSFASNRAGNWDIYVIPSTGGKPVQITDDAAHELHPSWSPDGRHLAYSRFGTQSQRWEMWVVDLDNPGVKKFVDYGLFPKWSPDPTVSKILFQRARERGSRFHGIWTIDFVNGEGSRPTEIVSASNAATINPAWSPDGQHIVFSTVLEPEKHASGHPTFAELWIIRVDGTGRTNLTRGEFSDVQPIWGADGKVYFVSNRSGRESIWSVSPTWLRKTTDRDPGTLVTVPTDAP